MDYLEVEDNLKMSKKFLDQHSDEKIENKLNLVEQHRQKETFSGHLKPSLSKQGNDKPNDVKGDGTTNLFSGDCNHPVTNSSNGDYKKDFSVPIYDKYEDECLDVVPTKPVVGSRSVSEEKLTVIQSQKGGKIGGIECA